MKGYLVHNYNGRGKLYFYNNLEDALKDKHTKWGIDYVEVVDKENEAYAILKVIR